ncbi:MAG: hypothetical protein KGL53_05505, partial [Elusimicrobia bacterium]|nr:hypothetical protein [Elusimicrobiota bacterium]
MRKLLATTLAAGLLVPAVANAEILRNLKVDGSLDVQAVSGRNVTDFTTRGDVVGAPSTTGQDRIGTTATR